VPAYAETKEYVSRVESKLGTAGKRRAPARRPDAAALAVTLRTNADGSVVLAN